MRITSIRAALYSAFVLMAVSPVSAQPGYFPSYSGYSGAPAWLEGWAGFGGSNNWYGGWAGFNYALNHNVDTDGFLIRAEGGGGHYDYNSSPAIGFINATYSNGSLLLGYRKIVPGIGEYLMVSGYVGAEVQDHNNPDPTAATRGTAWGVKFIGETYWRLNHFQDFYGMASFSSAFDTWNLLARPGFLVTPPSGVQLWIGPHLALFGQGKGWLENASSCPNGGAGVSFGSCKFEEARIGGFLHIVVPNQPLWGDWVLAGGYRKPVLANGGPAGYYAEINWNFRFQ